MGTCCSGRDKQKDPNTGLPTGGSTKNGLPTGSLTTNEIIKLQEYVKNFLRESKFYPFNQKNMMINDLSIFVDPQSNIIVINISKDLIKTFFAQLDKLMTLIKA